ncbi:MAG: pyridoxal-dependent decarboxylase [Acidobacteria bacterium]|nr:pyridoxal-dependent decarboxylase [Acidobacteriota bacterium]
MNPLEIPSDELRQLLEEVTNVVLRYVEDLNAQAIMPMMGGPEVDRVLRSEWPKEGLKGQIVPQINEVIRHSRAQNGRFFGYVLGSAEPVAAVGDLVASVLNQNVTAWRSSPAAVSIEKMVVEWLAQAIGCTGFQGSLTGGGSSANLMGLAMAREAKLPANSQGVGGRRGIVYASEEVHMSIPKSVALLGLGTENLCLIPTDEAFHMIPEELDRTMRRDQASGSVPVAIVASAGTVNTGAVDSVVELSRIARRHGAWLHVDGAYGALAALALPNRFSGFELVDSISLDPHKWLYQPLDCGCLLYRDAAAARRTFSHTGEYARVLTSAPIEGFAFFEESLELSRRFRALKLWLSLRYHGREAFRQAIKHDLIHARRLAEAIVEQPELQLLAPVELSAVCFRYLGKGGLSETELNRLNRAILKRVNERGRLYLSNATLRAKFCLRACVLNHRTSDSDIDSIVPEVIGAAREVQP